MLLPLFLSLSPPRVHSSSEPTPWSPPVKSVCLYVCARARLCPSGDAQRKRPHKGGQGFALSKETQWEELKLA